MAISSTTSAGAPLAAPARRALPLGVFAMPLGLTGFGGTWATAAAVLGATSVPAQWLYALGGLAWAVLVVIYVVEVALRRRTLRGDLHDRQLGPSLAYLPLIAVLLCGHAATVGGDDVGGWRWAQGALVLLAAVTAAWLLAHWLNGDLPLDLIHPGYLLPLVAGASIASIGLSQVGLRAAALVAFGGGLYFWVVISTIVIARLITRAQLASASQPLRAVLLSPPATGGVAWLLLDGGRVDALAAALAGVTAMFLLVQVVLLPAYLQLPFGMGSWAFSFPVAACTTFVLRWCAAAPFAHWHAVAWAVLVLASCAFAGLLLGTLRLAGPSVRRRLRAGVARTGRPDPAHPVVPVHLPEGPR